jgi:hypothetical protein
VPCKFPGGANLAGALLDSNGPVWSAVVIGLARFHFDEDQVVILPTDEIYFSGAGSHAKVASDDHDPVALQVTVRDVLAAAAKSMVGIEVV